MQEHYASYIKDDRSDIIKKQEAKIATYEAEIEKLKGEAKQRSLQAVAEAENTKKSMSVLEIENKNLSQDIKRLRDQGINDKYIYDKQLKLERER